MGGIIAALGRAGFGKPEITAITQLFARTDVSLNDLGEVRSTVPVQGRTEPLVTTVSQHDSTGKLVSTDAIAADGTGSPLTGGKRGFQALDTNNKLANSFHGTTVNLSNAPNSATTLSNDGVSHVVTIAAAVDTFAPGTVSDNGGSVDPGAFGTFTIYHDDPLPSGGPVIYQFTTNAPDQVAAEGRILDGIITTVGGSAKTGGGSTGGTTSGGGGGRGYKLAL